MIEELEWTPNLVLVDDEQLVLSSLKSFLSLETDYKINTFLSAIEALDFIEKNDIDLVLSDYLMPEMDGITFLSKVRMFRPEIPRIILTGYADKENAIKAINEVGIFHVLQKYYFFYYGEHRIIFAFSYSALNLRFLLKQDLNR